MPKTTECTASYTGLFSFDKEEHEWQMWRQDGWRPWRCSSVSFKAANTTQFSVSVKIRHEGRIGTFNSVYQLYNRYWYQCSSVKKNEYELLIENDEIYLFHLLLAVINAFFELSFDVHTFELHCQGIIAGTHFLYIRYMRFWGQSLPTWAWSCA